MAGVQAVVMRWCKRSKGDWTSLPDLVARLTPCSGSWAQDPPARLARIEKKRKDVFSCGMTCPLGSGGFGAVWARKSYYLTHMVHKTYHLVYETRPCR